MKKFFVYKHRDSANAYIKALRNAGYSETLDVFKADFIFYDHEKRIPPTTWESIKDKPTFIYPHTPYSWFIWDGICTAHEASCNFVYGENAKLGLELIGYPNRIEVCGFARCEVLPFRPSIGRSLLFAPAHPVFDGRLPRDEDYQVHRSVFDWVVKHIQFFDKVTVRILGSIGDNGFYEVPGIEFEQAAVSKRYSQALTIESSIASIERHDLIISCNTFGYIALARGKPTILYGNTSPRTREGEVGNYSLYRNLIDFPCPLESLSIHDTIRTCTEINPTVKEWRSRTIGANFDRDKFLSIVKEYL